MKPWVAGGFGGLAMVLMASSCLLNPGDQTAPPAPKDVTAVEYSAVGRQLFQQYCSSCHGERGLGDGPVSQLLKTTPPDLTTFAERREGKFSYTELANFIDGRREVAAHGSRIMPVWGQEFGRTLPDTNVREGIVNGTVLELVLFLESIQE